MAATEVIPLSLSLSLLVVCRGNLGAADRKDDNDTDKDNDKEYNGAL
jgi:hypothetical protein